MPHDCAAAFSDRLGFIAGKSMWAVARTGDWPLDNRTGAQHAEELIAFIKSNPGSEPLLGHVMRDIAAGGIFGGVEVGFCHRIAAEITSPVRGPSS